MSLRHYISVLRYPKSFIRFKSAGKNLRFGKHGMFARPEEIQFGSNIYIGPYFIISARDLSIGNNVLIGPRLLIEAEDHIFNIPGKHIWETRKNKQTGYVTIENDVWIGGNVTILKNVKIHEGCVIGAGSIVIKTLPPFSICVGIPCKPVRPRFTTVELEKHLNETSSKYSLNEVLNIWESIGFKF